MMKHAIPKIPRLILKRLPWIVAYALVITGILFLCDFARYRYADGHEFINYSSFRFNSTEEHKDVPFEACKVTDFAYHVVGNRTIYRIPEGKTEIDKVLVTTYPLDSIISKAPCVNAYITNDQYDFTPGNYQAYTTFNFTVKYGNPKSVTFKSNIFTILPTPALTVDQIQKQINLLQKQINLLKKQLTLAQRQAGVTNRQTQSNQAKQKASHKKSKKPTPTPKPDPVPTTQQSVIPFVGKPLIGCTLGVCL